MKENRYNDPAFFERYSEMARSVQGLKGAGEWHELQRVLPLLQGKRILDLGCGFGWHCKYAAEQGAEYVLGIDLSQRMLERARRENGDSKIEYVRLAMEDYAYPNELFDVVLSSLAMHYVEDFEDICDKVFRTLKPKGVFVFSCEHPVFTAEGKQDWVYGEDGSPLYWPVDRYYSEGRREALFLGEKIVKYHRTVTSYFSALRRSGFLVTDLVEPRPDPHMLNLPGMTDELRRPMMLILRAEKN